MRSFLKFIVNYATFIGLTWNQRVLNDLIEDHAATQRTGILRKRDNLLTEVGYRKFREEPNHTTARNPGPLKIIQYCLRGTTEDGGDVVGKEMATPRKEIVR